MLILAWITGIIYFVFTLVALGFSTFIFVGTSVVVIFFASYSPYLLEFLGDEKVEMFFMAFGISWSAAFCLVMLSRIFAFFEDVGKAIKNLANNDKR